MRRDRSCLPLWFLLSLITVDATGVSPACSAPPKTTDGARLVAVQPLREAGAVRHFSGMKSKQRLIIRDAATWASTWKEMTSIFGDRARSSAPVVPAVDFTKNVLIVAAMGTRESGGYWIDIDEVRIAAGEVLVSVSEYSPNGCAVTEAVTAPVAIAVVPRFVGRAMFVERTVQHKCP